MKDMNFSPVVTSSDLQRDPNARRLPIQGELEGHTCARCGCFRYVLVFRVNGNSQDGILTARCSRCREPRELAPGEIEWECDS